MSGDTQVYHCLDAKTKETLEVIADRLRVDCIESTNASNSGHPTSCASAAEVMSVLFFNVMKYSLSEPRGASNDRFVLSKGHAAPVLYAAWAEAGLFPVQDLLKLRKMDCDLEGHPTPRLNFVDVATGSLGQGLSCAAGMAYTGKYFDNAPYRVYCLIGDGESAEGSIWEAMHFASLYKLDNLVAIFDINRLGQSEPTSLGHNMDVYKARAEAFGFHTCVVNGHDVEALARAFFEASQVKEKPTCILTKTFKGHGIDGIADEENWHGKALGEKGKKALEILKKKVQGHPPHNLKPKAPEIAAPAVNVQGIKLSDPPAYKMGQEVATRLAYGTALVKLAKNNDRVIALDGDVKNSTFSIKLKEAFPKRYVECFIAEQNLVGVAVGCETRRRTVPFVSTFACFLSRAFDQIRMAAISQSNVNFCGSHAGISIGEDGPSQMALEDIAMFRAVPDCTVFYPSDAVSTERACELAANRKGMCFIRTSRPNIPVIYDNEEKFEVGKAKVVKQSSHDKVLVIGACVTLLEAMRAVDDLAKDKIHIRIMDLFTVKPIDANAIIKNAKECGGRILTVEDHYPEGGIGEAVSGAVSEERDIVVKKLAVRQIPRSGKPDELLERYGISAKCIVEAVKELVSGK